MFFIYLFPFLCVNFAFVVFTTKWCPPMVHRPEVRPWLPSQSGCPLWVVAAGVYTYRARWSNFRFAKPTRKQFFSILKKKITRKKYKSRIPLARYNTVTKPQLLPSYMLYIVGRLHIDTLLKYILYIHNKNGVVFHSRNRYEMAVFTII
jgi:hypothetical protein